MENTKISIVVPVYNAINFLEKCITSLIRQTYKNLEIIIVNDGSTDGSGELIEQLSMSDPRIKVIHQENGGLSNARNSGIKIASGDYIGFVDSDDYVAPKMYEHLMQFINQSDLEIAQVSRIEVNQNNEYLPDICEPPKTETFLSGKDFIRELLLHKGDSSFCTKLIKATLFEIGLFPEGILNEDIHLLIRLLPKVKKIGVLPEKYYYIVHHPDSLTRRINADIFPQSYSDMIGNADMIEDIIRSEYPELTKEAKRFALYQRLDYLLHIPISQMGRANKLYLKIIQYLRKNLRNILFNPHLTPRNKLYLCLFATAPRSIRRVHRKIRKRG